MTGRTQSALARGHLCDCSPKGGEVCGSDEFWDRAPCSFSLAKNDLQTEIETVEAVMSPCKGRIRDVRRSEGTNGAGVEGVMTRILSI